MSQSDPSDADDVRRTLAGDREAFARLFDRYARMVRAVVAAVSGDFGAVEDLTQETFLRAYRGLANLRKPDGFRQWLQGIARMVARELRRKHARDAARSSEEDFRFAVSEDATSAVEVADERRRVLSAVADLPERERLVVHAYFFHDEQVDAAAAAMGLSRSGFYAALNRGLNRLRERLADRASPNVRKSI